jgi:RNA-directed DNA polymerase
MDRDEFQATERGTPQGGVVSPLLANIALHGMEEAIKKAIKGSHIVRYADDFVILHKNLQSILKAKEFTQQWLSTVGLELRDDKTRITHTLEGGKDYQTGFDFLGFNVRQYRTPRRRINKTQRPYKTHIKPSKGKIKGIVKRLGDLIRKNRSISQPALIEKLNPIITGWANYHRVGVAKEIFSYLDHVLYLQLKRWAERRHPLKGKVWVKDKYWHTIGSKNWVFGVKQEGKLILELKSFNEVPISYHTKVVGEKSWYDGDWVYWGARRGEHPMIGTREATLLKRQNGRCTICRGVFDLYDQVEQDHALPRSKGGKDVYDNLQLLHSVCHHAKTSWDEKGYCPIRPWKKESDSQHREPETGFSEEPRGRQERSRMR